MLASVMITSRVFNPGHGCKHWDQRITRHIMIGSANGSSRNLVSIGECSRSQLRVSLMGAPDYASAAALALVSNHTAWCFACTVKTSRQLWDTTIGGSAVQASRPAPLAAPSLILTMGLLPQVM